MPSQETAPGATALWSGRPPDVRTGEPDLVGRGRVLTCCTPCGPSSRESRELVSETAADLVYDLTTTPHPVAEVDAPLPCSTSVGRGWQATSMLAIDTTGALDFAAVHADLESWLGDPRGRSNRAGRTRGEVEGRVERRGRRGDAAYLTDRPVPHEPLKPYTARPAQPDRAELGGWTNR
jgi:hypothetical protein